MKKKEHLTLKLFLIKSSVKTENKALLNRGNIQCPQDIKTRLSSQGRNAPSLAYFLALADFGEVFPPTPLS